MPEELKEKVRQMALEAGAVAAGFARAEPVDAAGAEAFSGYLERGAHFSMGYMENYRGIRLNPLLLFTPEASAGTVISMAFPYYHAEANPLFARYAQGEDYHKVLRRRLKPLARFISEACGGVRCRICVDTAPVLERYWARMCGIGFTGRNGCLIVPGAGSWCFLAEIVTEAVFEPDQPCGTTCGACGRCIRVCPGGALRSAGGFDSGRCLSCLTIEHRGEWPGDIPVPVAGSRAIYGCDECQRVCPHNAAAAPGLIEFAPSPDMRHLTPEDIQNLTPERYGAIFASSAVTRCPLEQLQRNVGILLEKKVNKNF